jgi:hypothetical protein
MFYPAGHSSPYRVPNKAKRTTIFTINISHWACRVTKVQRNASVIVCKIDFYKEEMLEMYSFSTAMISALLTLKHNLLCALFISLQE